MSVVLNMPISAWPDTGARDDTFKGNSAQSSTSLEALAPDVVSLFSAESSRTLSATLESHEHFLVSDALSHSGGLASAVISMMGSWLEASPVQAARAREQRNVNLMDLDPWAEPPVLSIFDNIGQVHEHPIAMNITTPKSTLQALLVDFFTPYQQGQQLPSTKLAARPSVARRRPGKACHSGNRHL